MAVSAQLPQGLYPAHALRGLYPAQSPRGLYSAQSPRGLGSPLIESTGYPSPNREPRNREL